MLIAGLQKNSLVDYRGKVAAVVFVPYCNFDCFYCHNRILLERDMEKAKYNLINKDEFFEFLDKRKGLIQGVVITGGEPTLQKGLSQFIREIKKKEFPVKLDTNGYKPDILEKLIKTKLLDYIAMDIKAPSGKYSEICGIQVDMNIVKKSIALIMSSGIDYEFRTTVVPGFSIDDIKEIIGLIAGAKRYTLQQFKKPIKTESFIDIRNMKKPHMSEFFHKAKSICEEHISEVNIRGVDI